VTGTGKYVQIDLGSNTLKTLSDSPLTLYFVLPPKNYAAGVTISIYDSAGNQLMKRTSGGQISVVRSEILYLGAIDFTSKWAGSNIYWDNSDVDPANHHLTFAALDDPDIETKKYYQGVFFNWGSLVGIGPTSSWSDSTSPIYYPNNMTATTTWLSGTAASHDNKWSGTTFGAIPYDDAVYYPYNTTIDRLNYTASGYKGDICRFLTANGKAPEGSWHMPTGDEISTAVGGSYKVGTAAYSPTVNAFGTTPITNFGVSLQGFVCPASGYFADTARPLYEITKLSQYKSSSASYISGESDGYGRSNYVMNVAIVGWNPAGLAITSASYRYQPSPVRCIKL
jgi:hypothetical protein